MKTAHISISMLVVSLFLAPVLLAQALDSANQSAASPAGVAEVPRLIKFSGTLLDAQDRPLAGPVGVTFALHAQQTGGAALWMETQNVTPDAHGNYTVLLGANSANGVPTELFSSGEARWLEVQVERQAEQPRVLLVSVPYALKAKDAETLGGKPASAFLTTETLGSTGTFGATTAPSSSPASNALLKSSAATTPKKTASTPQPASACGSVTSGGGAFTNSIALFTAPCNIETSLMTQALISGFPGVNLAGNNAGLLLNGTGTHQLTVTGATSGRLGQDSTGFFFSSDSNGGVIKFLTNDGALHEWMRITSAGNVGIHTQTPAATLDINGNLNLPNTASATVGVITLGGTPFLHNFGVRNTFAGALAGNLTMMGGTNSAFGFFALNHNTTGSSNSAFGAGTLQQNTTASGNSAFGAFAMVASPGSNNSAFGFEALEDGGAGNNSAFGATALQFSSGGNNSAFGYQALNDDSTGGSNNSAFGVSALFGNSSGNNNTAVGYQAGYNANANANTTGSNNTFIGFAAAPGTSTQLNNATAIGADAVVSVSNAMVLGSISGVNGCTPPSCDDTLVGIGITAPTARLHIGNTGGTSFKRFLRIEGPTTQIGFPGFADISLGGFGNFEIDAPGTQAGRFLVREDGLVGIGLSNSSTHPVRPLMIEAGYGRPIADGWDTYSSRRWKTNIHPLADALNKVERLRGVSYDLEKSGKHEIGVIAEEVGKVVPEVVTYEKNGKDAEGVDYARLTALLIEATKEQQREIQRLTGEVRKLRKAQQGMAQLQARLARLESQQRPAPAAVSAQKTANGSHDTGVTQGR